MEELSPLTHPDFSRYTTTKYSNISPGVLVRFGTTSCIFIDILGGGGKD